MGDSTIIDDGTQVRFVNNGSAAVPSIAFNNSLGTGLHTASNELRLSANGVLAQQVLSVSTRFLSGTTASPGIGFINDTDTGFIVRGSNNFGAVAGTLPIVTFANIAGTPVMAMIDTTTGKFYAGDGTALLPGITWENDTNTGIFRPAADTIGLACGGVTSSVFNSSGIRIPSITNSLLAVNSTGQIIATASTGGGGGSPIIRILGQTLSTTGWYATGSYYGYTFSNVNIGTASNVEFVPYNDYNFTIMSAKVQPYVLSLSGSAILYSQYVPSSSIVGDFLISTTT